MLNWERFRYVPEADERMVGLEVFNDRRDYGSDGGHAAEGGAYAFALDQGWHLGAIGAEDLGHRKPPLDDWGADQWPKTVVLAASRTPEAIRAAMLARRFYAVGPGEGDRLRLDFSIDKAPMGSRLTRRVRERLRIAARASDDSVKLELVTSGGKVVASGTDALDVTRAATGDERWYFVRVRGTDGKSVAYSSPVWVNAV